MKEKLLDKIINYYLESADFNGLPLYNIEGDFVKEFEELINDGMIEVLSENEVLNPYIKGFNITTNKTNQIQTLKNAKHACLYPTRKALQNVDVDHNKPYTALLQKGFAQFDIIFFDIEILQVYINNPKFSIRDYGYKGSIDLKPKYYDEEEIHSEYVKEYGMAYEKNSESIIRAVGVFVRDLSRLSESTQMRWKSYELKKQRDYAVQAGFVKNSIYGEFVMEHWIFDVILKEMTIINKQCEAIGIPRLFNHTFDEASENKPLGFSTLLMPTKRNYYEFMLALEKLFVHNINIKTFQKSATLVKPIERNDENGTPKGSLIMLDEWIKENVRCSFNAEEIIIKSLKEIRKIRQVPAHELYNDEFDVTLYEKQREMIEKVYDAIYGLRTMFAGHPNAKNIVVPEDLLKRKGIVFY